MIAISFGSIFARLAGWPPLVMACARCVIAAALFTILTAFLKKPKEPTGRLVVLAGVLLGAHLGLWIASLSYTTVAASVVLVESIPIWAAILSWTLKIDRIGPRTWAGVVFSVGGAAAIALSADGGEGSLLGNLLALGGAVTMAGSMVAGRVVLRTMDSLTYVRQLYTVAALALIPPMLLSRPTLDQMPLAGLPWLLAMCIGSQIIGHTMVNRSLAVLPPAKVSILLLSETILASAWAWIIFHERPGPMLWVGAILITIGVVLAVSDSGDGKRGRSSRFDAPS